MSMLLLVISSLFVGLGATSPRAVDKEAQATADAMVSRFVDSWNRADGMAYGENYWPDAELVDPTGAIVNGKTASVQEHIDLWNGIFKGSRVTGKVRTIRMLGVNYMIVDFDVQVFGIGELPCSGLPGPDSAQPPEKH